MSLKLILIDFLKVMTAFLYPIQYSALPFASPTSLVSVPSLSVVQRSTNNTYTQYPTFQFEGHEKKSPVSYFQLDGKHIVSGSKDRTIRVWSVENAKATLKLLEGHEVASFLSHFYPIGSALLLAQKLVLSGFGISRRVKH